MQEMREWLTGASNAIVCLGQRIESDAKDMLSEARIPADIPRIQSDERVDKYCVRNREQLDPARLLRFIEDGVDSEDEADYIADKDDEDPHTRNGADSVESPDRPAKKNKYDEWQLRHHQQIYVFLGTAGKTEMERRGKTESFESHRNWTLPDSCITRSELDNWYVNKGYGYKRRPLRAWMCAHRHMAHRFGAGFVAIMNLDERKSCVLCNCPIVTAANGAKGFHVHGKILDFALRRGTTYLIMRDDVEVTKTGVCKWKRTETTEKFWKIASTEETGTQLLCVPTENFIGRGYWNLYGGPNDEKTANRADQDEHNKLIASMKRHRYFIYDPREPPRWSKNAAIKRWLAENYPHSSMDNVDNITMVLEGETVTTEECLRRRDPRKPAIPKINQQRQMTRKGDRAESRDRLCLRYGSGRQAG
ncbi:hypothetical protein M011DRAFT_468748 [Sporormia fimetaria CBS 119925]|uniref:Uncharacterized protein n=1 Tax=Sporormia fimetaria CBS 119925 TaxID=1340428 RepID=A0A6A6VAG7_9PLEO|nr:hypothetical protein M011DRAFT_468748 [Sporormia fimetaria CBS 119925]